jgi:hypothetical protein
MISEQSNRSNLPTLILAIVPRGNKKFRQEGGVMAVQVQVSAIESNIQMRLLLVETVAA